MAIGLGTVNDIPMPVPGSVSAIGNLCSRWAEITPWKRKRRKMLQDVYQRLQGLIMAKFLLRLPSGNCDLIDHGLLKA